MDLASSCWTTAALYREEGLTYEEIGLRLGLTKQAVGKVVRQGYERICKHVKKTQVELVGKEFLEQLRKRCHLPRLPKVQSPRDASEE